MVGKFTDPSLVQRAAEVAGETAARDASSESALRYESVVGEEPQEIADSRTDLSKDCRDEEGYLLNEVLLLLEWTNPAGSTNPQGQQDYLDGSCMVYSEERLLDVVDFRGAHSAVADSSDHKPSSATLEWSAGKGKAASVLHSGDVMSAEGGTHVIRACLSDLPGFTTDLFFVISAYNCRNLSLFRSLNMRLFDACTPSSRPLTTFTTSDAGHASAALVCALTRKSGRWFVRSFMQACDGTIRDYTPIEKTIAPVQENHSRWRRRRPYVLLSCLWHMRRAVLHDERQDDDDVLVPLVVKLHVHLFQYVMQFI